MFFAILFTAFSWQAHAQSNIPVDLQGQTLTNFLTDRHVQRFLRCETSNYRSDFYTGYVTAKREVLILQTKEKYNVLVGEQKERHYRKLSISKARIGENESGFNIIYRTHNPFYPRKLELSYDKNKNSGKFYAIETNGIFGILGDSDTFIENWDFSNCTFHTLPQSFTWADYFYAHSVKFKF